MAKLAFYGNGPARVGKVGLDEPLLSFNGKTDEHGNPLCDGDGILIHDPQPISRELEAEIRANIDGWEAKGFKLIEDTKIEKAQQSPTKAKKS